LQRKPVRAIIGVKAAIAALATISLCLISCKESESHKAKRLGRAYETVTRDVKEAKPDTFSFSEVVFDKDSKLTSTHADSGTLILADALPSGPLAMEGSWTVVDVYDGDTITISDGYGELKVRLLGYDTPEMRDADPLNKAIAKEARDYLRSLIIGRNVRLRLDKNNIRREHLDRYGRTLAYVYRESDRLYLNAQMMRMGYSKEYEKFAFEDLRYFRTLAAEARKENRGMWALETNLLGSQKTGTQSTRQ